MNKQELIELLQKQNCKVTFIKKNGERRVMLASLNPDLVKDRILGTGRKVPEHIIPVIDLEKDEWRSFDINSVVEIRELTD